MGKRLVIPIRNCQQPLVVVSPWLFPSKLCLDQIADEDFATLLRDHYDVFTQIVTPKSQCFTVDLGGAHEVEQMASDAIAKVQFVFKTLSSVPLVLSHAAVVNSQVGKKAEVEKLLSLPVWGDYSEQSSKPFAFKADVKPEEVVKFYEIIHTAVSKHPAFSITLSRFNSCWLRSTEHDKIIDVAISLESLLSSSTEISFKFALFNSFIARQLPADREEAFQLFRMLYDARSKIVHGDTKKHIKEINKTVECLPKILDLAHAAISYYAFFLYNKSQTEWADHLAQLIFGTVARIDPNQSIANENSETK